MSFEDEAPILEEVDQTPDAPVEAGKQTKRYAKAMGKFGLKPEAGIVRVSVKKEKSITFVISQCETYRFPRTNTFVVFGEVGVDDIGASAQQSAAKTVTEPISKGKAAVVADDDDVEEDAGDLDEKEISLVMSQGNVTRNQAIRVLKENNGDVVNSIMQLTM
eukprot:Tbor_TRINITY_DN5327_c7_g3::TRINITY_DN5327_c7_g3_i1::g.4969::m.4969/K03626/EGD2, NACA; nascent polypeptide-associated complex subunit alpha